MNILEAFDQGLPDIPARSGRKGYPKLDPTIIFREHMVHGEPQTFAKMPGDQNFVRLTPPQWALLQLFDGVRSYEEIAELLPERAGVIFTVEDVKEFASYLDDKTNLFYKTPLEKNITLKQKLGHQRHKHKRFAFKDVSEITLHQWPHADDYITRLHPYVAWIYTTWFTILTLICFAAMFGMWADKFGEIWNDSFQFYNFAGKTGWDIFQFWFLFGAMAFCHETAHGMTCKHNGANVEAIEFLLMFFSPTFVCDCSQIWVLGDRRARLQTIIAGLWFDLVICFVATTFWWFSAPGMFIHDAAYKVMMVTGIGVTLLNLNPLIKLDGYYLFSEIVQEVDLYERSRTFLADWTRKHIYRLPVEPEYLPRRRRVMYLIYGVLSCSYGYILLLFVALFLYHVLRYFSPEYAWVPALGLSFLMFRSGLRKLVKLMREIYLDKKERVRNWFTPARIAVCSASALIVLFTPIWPDNVECRFVLEPSQHAVIRTSEAGIVKEVRVHENDQVQAGQELVTLGNLSLESEAAKTRADLQVASARASAAHLRYADFGRADREREETSKQTEILSERLSDLSVKTPVRGVVVTPRLQDLLGTYVTAGTLIAEVSDRSQLKARLYIPEFEIRDVRAGTRARLHVDGKLLPVTSVLAEIGPVSSQIDAGLLEKEQLAGIVPPPFYIGWVNLPSNLNLAEGMTGTAKLFVDRRSPAGFCRRLLRDLVERRLW